MKKLLIIFVTIISLFFSSCQKSEKENPSQGSKMELKSIDMQSAKEFMDNYMRFVMKMDIGPMRSFYSSTLRDKIKNIPILQNPHPIGYKIEEGESKEDTVEFKAHIYNGVTAKPYFSDDTFKYTIMMKDSKLLIDKIQKDKTTELYMEDRVMLLREGDKIKGDKLFGIYEIPNYVVPKDTTMPEQKFSIPKKHFGACAISPDGKEILFTSYDKNTFLALVKMQEEGEGDSEETMAKKEVSDGDQGDEESGGGGNQGDQSNENKTQNKTSKMNFKQIDFLFNSTIDTISFSPDGKNFVIEYSSSNGNHRLLIYEKPEEEFERKPVSIERQFKPGLFSIKQAFFISPDDIIFNVYPLKNTTDEEKKYKGQWQLNLKTGVIFHLK